MNLDLNNLLKDWPHEPGQMKVRKILGNDGVHKLQLRIDLGMIQMETSGRPDGHKPNGCDSLLDYHREKAKTAESEGKEYVLTAEDCAELQQEGVQYYHRYLSFFQLHEFEAVLLDTARNLELFDFVQAHAQRADLAWGFQQFRPHVLMMHTKAKASMALMADDYETAIQEIEQGKEEIEAFFDVIDDREMADNSTELQFLTEWLDEIRSTKPVGRLERMQRELRQAIEKEEYEQAAKLRDAIKELQQSAHS